MSWPTVLIVEDDVFIPMQAVVRGEKLNHQGLVAHDMDQALAVLHAGTPMTVPFDGVVPLAAARAWRMLKAELAII